MKKPAPVVAGVFLVVAACSGGGVDTTTMTTPFVAGSAVPETTEPLSAPAARGQHHVFDSDTVITARFVLRPGDSVELRNGARLSFGPGGSADWQGTPTSTWSNDGNTQNLVRDINIFGQGDIRFEQGSLASTIRYVNVNLQPSTALGHYPLHWHHAGDGVRGTLVEGVVVQNSTNHGFVPHASHGITFKDTIAKNIIGDAYWWDRPPAEGDQSNNSRDTLFDHALADGVQPKAGDNRRFGAFFLGAGTGNAVINSAAMNVGGDKNAGGFVWPEIASRNQPLSWRFENNVAHHNSSTGIFVWQNNPQEHIIDGFRAYNNDRADIEHGAYANLYDYRNVDVDTIITHAMGWSVTGGRIGTVKAVSHALPPEARGPAVFTNVSVDKLIIDNDNDGDNEPGHYVFNNTGLGFNDITVTSAVPGTNVTINGETRTFG